MSLNCTYNKMILRYFLQVATDYLEGDLYISIAGVIPVIKGLLQTLCPNDEDSKTMFLFKKEIVTRLENRFSFKRADERPTTYHLATWLHPYFKQRYIKQDMATQVGTAFNT